MHFRMPRLISEFQASLAERLFCGFSPHLQERIVGICEPMFQVENINQVRRAGKDCFVESPLMLRAGRDPFQSILSQFSFGNVSGGAEPLHHLASSIAQWNST